MHNRLRNLIPAFLCWGLVPYPSRSKHLVDILGMEQPEWKNNAKIVELGIRIWEHPNEDWHGDVFNGCCWARSAWITEPARAREFRKAHDDQDYHDTGSSSPGRSKSGQSDVHSTGNWCPARMLSLGSRDSRLHEAETGEQDHNGLLKTLRKSLRPTVRSTRLFSPQDLNFFSLYICEKAQVLQLKSSSPQGDKLICDSDVKNCFNSSMYMSMKWMSYIHCTTCPINNE